MKSDELYIAEIYEKARLQKTIETQDAENVSDIKTVQGERKLHYFRGWQELAAVACLCLVIVGAFGVKQQTGKDYQLEIAKQENVTVTAEVISFAESVGPRARTADAASQSGVVLTILLDEKYRDIDTEGILQVWVSDESIFQAGEHVKLTLVSEEGRWKLVSAEHDEQEKED